MSTNRKLITRLGAAARLLAVCGLLLGLASPGLAQQGIAKQGLTRQAVTLQPDQPLVWNAAADVPEPMIGWSVQCPDQPESFYVVGGVGPTGDTANVYRFDAAPMGGSWTAPDELAPLPQPRRAHALACFEGKIYAVGGYYQNIVFDTLFIYDIASDTWLPGADLPDIVWGAAMGAWDGKLYLAGGGHGDTQPDNQVDVYDIAMDTWTDDDGTHMPVATGFAASIQAGPYLYIAGGIVGSGDALSDTTQRYNMATNAWEQGPDLTMLQWGGGLATSGSRLYLLGGSDNIDTRNSLDKVDVLELADWYVGMWMDLGDSLPQDNILPGTACTEAMAGGEVWAAGGADWGIEVYNDNLYRPAEPCISFGALLAPESLSGEGYSGETVEYILTITNTGNLTDYFSITASGLWTVTVPTEIGPLDAGESAEVLATVEIPADALAGEADIATLTVASKSNPGDSAQANLTTTALESYANLEVGHLAPFAMDPSTAVTVTLDSAPVLTGFAFADSIGYITVTANVTHTVEIFAMGVLTPAISADINLMPDTDYTAIAIGGANGWPLELLALQDDNSAPADGKFHLRLGHLAPFAETITDTLADIRLQDGTPVITDVPFGAVTAFIPLDAGTYDLKITTPGGGTTLIDPLPVTFNEGQIVSAYAVGDGVNQPLGVFAWPAGVPGLLLELVDIKPAFSPVSLAGSAHPGHVVEYTLTLTNAGNITDTFDLAFTGNEWDVTLPVTQTELAAGASLEVVVQVLVPAEAADGELDSVAVTATSQGDPTATASAELTTTSIWWKAYLPLIPQES